MSNGAALYGVSPFKREKETNLLLTQCTPGGGEVACGLLGTGRGAGCLGWVMGMRAGWAELSAQPRARVLLALYPYEPSEGMHCHSDSCPPLSQAFPT